MGSLFRVSLARPWRASRGRPRHMGAMANKRRKSKSAWATWDQRRGKPP
jgi:hypothetical protein